MKLALILGLSRSLLLLLSFKEMATEFVRFIYNLTEAQLFTYSDQTNYFNTNILNLSNYTLRGRLKI